MPGTALCDSSSHTCHSPAGLARLVLQCAALLGSNILFVPARFLNLSEAQMPQGWTPEFVIKVLICMNLIPYSVQIPNLPVKPFLTDMYGSAVPAAFPHDLLPWIIWWHRKKHVFSLSISPLLSIIW